ncbi:MAG: type II toxin-antitoxin system RelE/ParE family toxin [Lentisphaeria bacterium]|nr:type II toxin-antitoxin system RelE/ParE family toxin [Lentisphaeria bacterium]
MLHAREPAVHRALGEDTIREMIEGNYRLIYQVLDDRINVLTVVHRSRKID